jgi:hypothetical protein
MRIETAGAVRSRGLEATERRDTSERAYEPTIERFSRTGGRRRVPGIGRWPHDACPDAGAWG